MEKVDFNQQFACRLRDAMIASGLKSPRSTSGVSIHKLAEITGYSLQICRKYLRGEAIPEPIKLVEIANKLDVSPGWLLFGEHSKDFLINDNNITISKNILQYIFSKADYLYNHNPHKDVSAFLMDLLQDVGQIKANEEQTKKIIDLALSSVKHFTIRLERR